MEHCDSSVGYSNTQQFLEDNDFDFDSAFQYFNQNCTDEERKFSGQENIEESALNKLSRENEQKKRKLNELPTTIVIDVTVADQEMKHQNEILKNTSSATLSHPMVVPKIGSDVDVKEFDRKLYFMKISNLHYLPLHTESRTSYLYRVPHLLQLMLNRFDIVRFDEIIKEAFTVDCEAQPMHSKPVVGRHLITERYISRIKCIPDWVCMRSPCKVQGRVISFRELDIGTFIPTKFTGKRHFGWILKTSDNEVTNDPNLLYSMQRFREALRDKKPLKFECVFQNIYTLNEAMTHIEKIATESPIFRFL